MANLSWYETSKTCTVCKNHEAEGANSSSLCTMTIPFSVCWDCFKENLVPWDILVHPVVGIRPERRHNLAKWEHVLISKICDFYDRTEEQLWRSVELSNERYY